MEAESAVDELDLARLLVFEVAPEEGEAFDVISDAYQRDPQTFARPDQGRDEMLGFGIEAAAVLMTPVVLSAIGAVVKYLATEVGAALGVKGWLRRLLRRQPDPTEAIVELNPDQVARVRAIVLDKCRQAGATEAKSQLLADGVVGALTAAH